jgi:hypothetical protein
MSQVRRLTRGSLRIMILLLPGERLILYRNQLPNNYTWLNQQVALVINVM